MRLSFFLAFIVVCILYSCQNSNSLVEQTFEKNCWNISDTLKYNITSSPNSSRFDFKLKVHFLEDYAYRNFYYKCQFISPSGHIFDTLIHQTMIDEQGYWNQESSLGKTYIYEFPHTFPLKMNENGIYKMNVFHYMRDSNICDIKRIAILK